MSEFKLITELKSGGIENKFLVGYASTIDPDNVNDIVDEEGQKSTYNEIKSKQITMDEDHEEFRDPETGKLYDGKKNKFPIAKVVETRLDSKGTWIKALLNRHHPQYNRILNMIKEKYLHSFSIAYNVKKAFKKLIGNTVYKIIQSLVVKNIGITGNPVNEGASFSIALKSFTKKMEDEKLNEMKVLNTELKSKVEGFDKEKTELKSEHDKLIAAKDKEISTLKSDNDKLKTDVKPEDENKETDLKSLSDKFTSMESEIKDLQKDNTELKSVIESPQLKSLVNKQSKDPDKKIEKVSMFEAMRY